MTNPFLSRKTSSGDCFITIPFEGKRLSGTILGATYETLKEEYLSTNDKAAAVVAMYLGTVEYLKHRQAIELAEAVANIQKKIAVLVAPKVTKLAYSATEADELSL